MKTRTIIAALLALALIALGGCTTKIVTSEGAAQLYTVTAGGEGKTVAAPDVAEMYFGATVSSDDAKTALKQASDAAGAITAAVKKAGVAAEDIQTANISVYPEQSGDSGKITITGYRASVQVRVKLRDISKVGDVIGAASDAGANEISGPTFTLSNDSEARNKAIELAIADARGCAQVMAKAAGKTLGEIVSVSESGFGNPVYVGAKAEAMDVIAVPVEPGQLEITANVTVVFELK